MHVTGTARRAPGGGAEVEIRGTAVGGPFLRPTRQEVAEPGRSQSSWAWSLSLSLSLSLAGVPSSVAARPSVLLFGQASAAPSAAPSEAALRLHRDGDRAYEEKDFARARDAWIGAYNALAPEASLVSYRATLLTLINDATLRANEHDAAAGPLRVVIPLYETFLERYLPGDSNSRPQIEEELRQLRSRLPAAPSVQPPAPNPVPLLVPAPAPAPAPDAGPAVPDRPASPGARPSSRVAVPLLATGSVVLAGGIAALVAGARFRPRAEEQVDTHDDPVAREDAFVTAEAKKGALWMTGGAVAAAAGLSLIIAGAVLHGRNKRREAGRSAARIVPWLDHPGVILMGRF